VDRLKADPVDVVAVDAGAQQLADHQGVPALGGADQSRAVPAVLVVDPGAVAERDPEQVEVALTGGDEIGRLVCLVLGVDVGALPDQASGPYDVSCPGRCAQLLVQDSLLVGAGCVAGYGGAHRFLPRRRWLDAGAAVGVGGGWGSRRGVAAPARAQDECERKGGESDADGRLHHVGSVMTS
jgi:hypothetical protein